MSGLKQEIEEVRLQIEGQSRIIIWKKQPSGIWVLPELEKKQKNTNHEGQIPEPTLKEEVDSEELLKL
ncbi:MAG: hypothetical protein CM1200mP30_06530 [Pseudomonadota bacterium]|nr:MAG: hypothetical protein CM1200mP30_06530 [Pseudomonadota bacterium]